MNPNPKPFIRWTWLLAATLLIVSSCANDSTNSTDPPAYQTTFLVADASSFSASRTDANLLNAWGIALTSSGDFWIGANHSSMGLNYDRNGAQVNSPIVIPARDSNAGGAPSGAVVNNTADFNGAKVIFSTEDGIIAAWSSGSTATQVAASASTDGVYKGLAMAASGGANYLYATDFRESKIDVYDKNFMPVNGMSFSDPSIPAGYGPFGIANIGGQLYITFALKKLPDMMDDSAGPGFGYVDVFDADGSFVKRFASQGNLNSPWGIAAAGSGFGTFKNAILIGNFGDGHITGYDQSGNLIGQLKDKSSNLITIDGLWGLAFNSIAGDPNFLYFTSGPSGENDGAFGYVQLK
jgi:uncharacterized protein (TIGR03118 family)